MAANPQDVTKRDRLVFQVRLPDGRPAEKAEISLGELPILNLAARTLHTGADGSAKLLVTSALSRLAVEPAVNGQWKIAAHWTSPQGISWAHESELPVRASKDRIRIPNAMTVLLMLSRLGEPRPHLRISPTACSYLSSAEGGGMVLDDLVEMLDSARASLPSGTAALAGRALGGFLRIRGRQEGWWRRRFDTMTLGILLKEQRVTDAIERRLAHGDSEILRAAVLLRNQSVHNNGAPITIEAGVSVAQIVLRAVNTWE